jgi:hypothetical protein|tara:strand:- start:1036 stop:1245 length:210 start_codon:yes stop_codon:yes gene_type:complete
VPCLKLQNKIKQKELSENLYRLVKYLLLSIGNNQQTAIGLSDDPYKNPARNYTLERRQKTALKKQQNPA